MLGEFGIFFVAALRLRDRVFLVVFGHLLFKGVDKVYVQFVGKRHHPVKHVGEFFGDILFVFAGMFSHFLDIFPLEVFHNFGGFQCERNCQVFRIMKLVPVTLVAKITDKLLEGLKGFVVGVLRVCHRLIVRLA